MNFHLIVRSTVFLVLVIFAPTLMVAQSPSPSPTALPAVTVVLPTTFGDIPAVTAEEKKAWLAEWLQYDWDREKYEKRIITDEVVIHHTDAPSGISWQTLSEIQYQSLYIPRYNSNDKDPFVKGLTAQSGHFRFDETGSLVQVYYAYHAIVRSGGISEQLLNLTEVGWNSGNWDQNMRSVALVFDGDFEQGDGPSKEMLKTAAKQILEWKKILPLKYLKAHKEVSKKTACPGSWWDTKGKDGKTGREKLAKMTGLKLIS